MDHSVNLKEITEKLNLSPRRVQQLARAGVFVKTGRGEYDLLQCALSYIEFLKRRSGSESEFVLSLKDIAFCTNQSIESVIHLSKLGIFKKISHGQYDFMASMQNYIVYLNNRKREGRSRSDQLPVLFI